MQQRLFTVCAISSGRAVVRRQRSAAAAAAAAGESGVQRLLS